MGFPLKKILVLWGWAILIASVWVLWLSVVNPDNYAYQRIKTFFTTDEQEKKDNFPNEVEEAKQQCREIIRDLRRLLNGEVEFTEEALLRIDEAHFGISVLMD